MKVFLFLLTLVFSFSVFSQAETEEKEKSIQRERENEVKSNSNTPTRVEPSMEEIQIDEAPAGNAYFGVESYAVQESASKIKETLKEVSYLTNQKYPTTEQQQTLNFELSKIESVNQNTFEYFLYRYKIGNYNFNRISDLKKAHKLKPNHPEVLKSLAAYYYINNKDIELKESLKSMHLAKHFSNQLSSFANDVLNSLPKNAVFITHGDEDTYPLLIEQVINKTRTDIQIVSLDHLQSSDYRNKLKAKGFKLPSKDKVNTSFFNEFVSLNNGKNIVVATTIPKDYITSISSGIIVDGLGYSFGREQKGHKRQLVKTFESEIEHKLKTKLDEKKSNKLLANYLPLLFEIRNYWIDEKDDSEVKEIENYILEIGKYTGKSEMVQNLLK
ncbi:MAG: hypothetical protein WED10_14880 [Brumimicrobium sp.]